VVHAQQIHGGASEATHNEILAALGLDQILKGPAGVAINRQLDAARDLIRIAEALEIEAITGISFGQDQRMMSGDQDFVPPVTAEQQDAYTASSRRGPAMDEGARIAVPLMNDEDDDRFPDRYVDEDASMSGASIELPFAKRLPIYLNLETDWNGFARLLTALSVGKYQRARGSQGWLSPYRVMEYDVEAIGNGKVRVSNLRVDVFLLYTEPELEKIKEEEETKQTMPTTRSPRRPYRGPHMGL